MAAFLADSPATLVTLTDGTTANVALATSGPATFMVTNLGGAAVSVALTQTGTGTISTTVIPSGWPMMLQCANPERVPGTVYALVTAINTGSGFASNVYITSGFEV